MFPFSADRPSIERAWWVSVQTRCTAIWKRVAQSCILLSRIFFIVLNVCIHSRCVSITESAVFVNNNKINRNVRVVSIGLRKTRYKTRHLSDHHRRHRLLTCRWKWLFPERKWAKKTMWMLQVRSANTDKALIKAKATHTTFHRAFSFRSGFSFRCVAALCCCRSGITCFFLFFF